MKPVAHFTHTFTPAYRATELRWINVKLFQLEQDFKNRNIHFEIEVKLFEIVGPLLPAPQVVTYDATKED